MILVMRLALTIIVTYFTVFVGLSLVTKIFFGKEKKIMDVVRKFYTPENKQSEEK